MCVCLSAPCLTKCLQMVVHVCLSSHALVFSPVDLYLVVVGELLTKMILFICVYMDCLFNETHSGWKIKVVKVFRSLSVLGFQKGWGIGKKKHTKAIRSPCVFTPATRGVNTPPLWWLHSLCGQNNEFCEWLWCLPEKVRVHWIQSYYFS